MKCNKHKEMIVLHDLSVGKCNIYDCDVVTDHTPCNKVCGECSKQFKVCQVCGDRVYEERLFE